MTTNDLRTQLEARIDAARAAVRPHVIQTPLTPFPLLSEATGAQILLKCEHLQHTGSFKVRGALAKLAALSEQQRARGVVAASTGNHGLGVAYALSVFGGTGIVCVPPGASPVKVAAIRRFGVEVREMGADAAQTEVLARAYADDRGLVYVSPYNDLDVIAGQASIGVELLEQLDARPFNGMSRDNRPGDLDAVIVSVGGGGLSAGVAAALKRARPDVLVVGASPANDAAMAASVVAGRIVDVAARATVSDGTAGGIEAGAITFELCRELIDEWVLVSEDDIAVALRLVVDGQHQLIEGAAATAVAAAAKYAGPGQRVVVISCGANISSATLQQVLLRSQ
jgi:threonine dehydratase